MDHQRLGIHGITKAAYRAHSSELSNILADTSDAKMYFWSEEETFSFKCTPEIVVSTTIGLSLSVRTSGGDVCFTLKSDEYDYSMISHHHRD